MHALRVRAHVERRGRLGDARRKELRAVPLAGAARGLHDQPLHLLLRDRDVLQILPRKQHLRPQAIRELLRLGHHLPGLILQSGGDVSVQNELSAG